jgi:hypothetical protein
MSDVMLLGVLRMPLDYVGGPLSPMAQFVNRAREAADRIEADAERIEEMERALHEIAEEWAGAECGEPVYAQEAYAIGLARRMYCLAAEALKEKT